MGALHRKLTQIVIKSSSVIKIVYGTWATEFFSVFREIVIYTCTTLFPTFLFYFILTKGHNCN